MKTPLVSPSLPSRKIILKLSLVGGIIFSLQGCAVVAVADAAVTVIATGVKVTAKAVGAVADAVIPDSDDDN
jgi:hypothetical protein